MTTVAAKDIYVTWNGDLAHWPDYVRKVRLQYEKTEPSKRCRLGPELVSRLTDKAWQASFEIDHARLSGRYGAKYMISYLRERLCQAPVPDAGARLEDLLIRLRRKPGTPFSQWSHEVREAYRRLQRALLRTRQEFGRKEEKKKEKASVSKASARSTTSEPEPRPPSTGSERSPTRSARSREATIAEEEDDAAPEAAEADAERDADSPQGHGEWSSWRQWGDRWTPEEWNEWLGRKKKHGGSDTSWSQIDSDDEDQDVPWDELEVQEAEVLPGEVLGWILLRRAGLTTQNRLAVQASVGNSLKYEDIERALRDQEEELLAAERRPQGKGHGYKGGPPKRTFWVEQDKEWGLLDYEPDQDDVPVHWIGSKLPEDVYEQPHPEVSHEDEDTAWWVNQGWDESSWNYGTAWWNESEPELEFSTDEQKQLDEIYAAYEDKVRTFVQARALMKNKTNNRGFFPQMKGKIQRNKGMQKGKNKNPSPVMVASPSHSSGSGKGRQRPGEPEYTGCFICGSREHSFLQCPKRHQRKGGGSAHYVDVLYTEMIEIEFGECDEEMEPAYMVSEDNEADETVAAWTVRTNDDKFHAVIDCGATETVASLHALTAIMNRRQSKFGFEEMRVHEDIQKTFKFGNGKTLQASSYVEIPQTIAGVHTWLGVHALDTEDRYVPLLVGIRTLERLAAVIDFGSKTASFCAVSDELVPLQQCERTGHLLLDLSSDWIDASFDAAYKERNQTFLAEDQLIEQPLENQHFSEGCDTVADVPHDHDPHPHAVHVPEEEDSCQLESHVVQHPCQEPGLKVSECDPVLSPPGDHVLDALDSSMQSSLFGERRFYEGQGEEQGLESETPRRSGLRLCSEGRAGPQGSSPGRRGVQGPTCDCPFLSWIPFRKECLGNVESLPAMQAEDGVCSSFRCPWPVSQCWTSGGRHERSVEGEGKRDQGESGRALYTRGGFGRCREEHASPIGDHPPTEGELEEDQGRNPSCEEYNNHIEEGLKEERCYGSGRVGGGSGGVGRLMDKDIESSEVSTSEHVLSLLAETMNDTTTAFEECMEEFSSLNLGSIPGPVLMSAKESHVDLLEVCCPPDSALAAMVEKLGGTSARVTEKNMNLTTVDGLEAALQFVRKEKPRWLWVSFPCGATSPIQHLNELSEEAWLKSMARRRKSRRLVRRGLKLLRVHVFENDGDFGWEWPTVNDAWKWKEVQEFLREVYEKKPNLYRTLLHGCQVGVKNDKDELVKKPWTIYTTDRAMASALNLTCPGGHVHGECLGGKSALKTGFYPPKMVRLIARQILSKPLPDFEVSEDEVLAAFGLQGLETEVPEGMNPTEWKRIVELVRRLHVRAGHPSARSLMATLKARGAHPIIILAAKYFQCDDCAETKRSVPAARASFHRSDTLWHTLQIDNAQFKVGTQVVNVMLLVDEASTFMVPHLLHRLEEGEHENATAEQVVEALQSSWVRFFGHPSVLRLDPEGAFRSRLLEDFCSTRDIDLQPCAAEAHYQIGVVERSIGTIRKSVERFMRSNAVDPWEAIVTMCAAHNEVGKVAGFSPSQWALGRSLGLDEKRHESFRDGTSLHTAQKVSEEQVHQTMEMRLKAEAEYRKNMAQEAINRAWNSKAQKREVWTPGTLVYYKRYKAPATSQASHKDVDVTRRQIARWYGPARILATETLLDGDTARPGHIIWITAAGRLKRVAPEQVRLASETEKILSEADKPPPHFDWTIQGMLQEVDRGQYDTYDDLVRADAPLSVVQRARSAGPAVSRRTARSRTPAPKKTESRPQEDPTRSRKRPQSSDVRPVGDSKRLSGQTSVPSRAEEAQPAQVPADRARQPQGSSRMVSLEGSAANVGEPPPNVDSASLQPGRFLSDPSYELSHGGASRRHWTGELRQNPLFAEARRRHEKEDRPLHIKQKEDMTSFACEELSDEVDGGEHPLMVALSVEMPTDEKSLKHFKRDPVTWTANKLKKHAEVRMETLTPEQVKDMDNAKQLEVSQWIQAAACKALEKNMVVPKGRTMKMRWVLTFKSSGAAKARIVIVGFTDPDLGRLSTTSPTMTRRTRQLMMTRATCSSWTQIKCDAKSAFLQTSRNTEEHRSVFAIPVPELAQAMGVPPNQAVQIVKSCYGLVNAPHEWYLDVRETIEKLGGESLLTEPCCWRIRDPETGLIVGLIGSHVDDFYMVGEDGSAVWNSFLQRFKEKYRWSPWECDSFEHCGVHLHQTASKEIVLDHAKFCTGIQQISVTTKDPKMPATPEEVEQLRAVLGAAQWRVVQSAPQHGARLSQLQSRITRADGQTLAEANKLVREIYNTRMVSPKTQDLDCNPEEVEFVCWTDAALANRVDLGSTGGFLVAATSPDLRKGRRAKINMISWKSFKLRRVARSSLAAEVQAFSEGEEELMYCRLEWAEMLGMMLDPLHPEDLLSRVNGTMVTDAKSLYDAVQKGLVNTSGLGLTEKYSSLELLSVMERLERGQTETRWVDSHAQLADALTKHQSQSSLHQVLIQGYWTLVYDPQFVSAKRKAAALRQDS